MSKLIWGSSVNKVLLIAVSVVGLIGTSGAEAKMAPKMPSPVMAPPAHSSWSGPYLGAGLDFMMGSTSVNDTGVVTETGAATNGALVRLLGGYTWQLDDLWVAGIEGSVAFGNVHGNGISLPPSTAVNTYDLSWEADLSARIGYLVTPDTLLFGTFGPSLTDLRFTEGSPLSSGAGVTRVGWSVGVGLDHQFTDHLTGRIEFTHADYGSVTYGTPSDFYAVRFSANSVRAGLLWSF